MPEITQKRLVSYISFSFFLLNNFPTLQVSFLLLAPQKRDKSLFKGNTGLSHGLRIKKAFIVHGPQSFQKEGENGG